MRSLLKIKVAGVLLLYSCVVAGQSWIPVSDIHPAQTGGIGFYLELKEDGPLGKDWMYGSYWDVDSVKRCAAYRQGGKWNHLPFSCNINSRAYDIVMYGDTIYLSGDFGDVIMDKDSSYVQFASIIKLFDDSLWTTYDYVGSPFEMATKGDTLLCWGGSYFNPPSQVIYTHYMTGDRGRNWQYPYSIIHPTETIADFGIAPKLEILPNGDVLTLNGGSPTSSVYNGVVRWDGTQWNSYGNGLYGAGFVKALDFDFYKGELYMGGTFAKINTFLGDTISQYFQNPGNGIARWDGVQWRELGGGILEGGVYDIIVHDDVLFCRVEAGDPSYHMFGDVQIPFFAGWDGSKWCGTPAVYSSTPQNFGFSSDTLYVTFSFPSSINGGVTSNMFYFDGDYLHGPNAICSTPGLGEEESELHKAEIEVFPNPAGDFLKIAWPQEIETASYELLSLDGKLVQSGVLAKGENTLKINHKLSGVFLLKVISSHGVITKKIIFEN